MYEDVKVEAAEWPWIWGKSFISVGKDVVDNERIQSQIEFYSRGRVARAFNQIVL